MTAISNKKYALRALAAVLAATLCVAAALLLLPVRAEGSPFAETYALGETVLVPSRTVDAAGETLPATAVTVFPSGAAVMQDSVTLSEAGIYRVEYRAKKGGRTYKDVFTFRVDLPLYSLTTRGDRAEFGPTENYDGVTGLNVNLANGSAFTFNRLIDLDRMDGETPLISLWMTPTTPGALDCKDVIVRLEDAYDPDNYILMKSHQSPYGNDVAYIAARACNQPKYYGVENGKPDGAAIEGSVHGFASRCNFFGKSVGSSSTRTTFYYDNDTRTVYADNNFYSSQNKYVIDFGNAAFDEAWSGFTGGKARLSVSCGQYVKAGAAFVITDIAGYSLSEESVKIDDASEAVIDFGEYTAGDYPEGVVGSPYRVFPASSREDYTAEKVYVNVYTSYGSSVRADVPVTDGAFVPRSAVEHTIEYAVVDGFGHRRTFALPVQVNAAANAIGISAPDAIADVPTGEWVTVPEATYTGGDGNLTKSVRLDRVAADGSVLESSAVTAERVRVTAEGDYKLVFSAVDYNGQRAERAVRFSALPAAGPMFSQTPALPSAYLAGGTYAVPALTADDFSSGELVVIPAIPAVTLNGEPVALSGNTFRVTGEGTLKITYTATDGAGRSDELEASAPAVDTGLAPGKTLDLAKYFAAAGGSVSLTSEYMCLSATADATFAFVRELLGNGFETAFNIPAGANNFSSVEFRFTEVGNPAVRVTAVLSKGADGKSMLALPGKRAVPAGYDFGGDVKRFNLTVTGAQFAAGSATVNAEKDDAGNPFDGFDGAVMLEIAVKGVSGRSEIALYSLNRQPLRDNVVRDMIEPRLMFDGTYGGDMEYGDTVNLSAAYAIDVLDPNTELTFSVRLPGTGTRDYATSADGIKLQNVSCDRAYAIRLTSYGRYSVTYTGSDGSGNPVTFSYVINCVDREAPVLTPAASSLEGKTGEAVTVPDCEVSDNVSSGAGLKITVQIVNPEGRISTAKEGTFVPDTAGDWTIRYLAFDENYNLSAAEVTVTVK